jgi:hypothetical protein
MSEEDVAALEDGFLSMLCNIEGMSFKCFIYIL